MEHAQAYAELLRRVREAALLESCGSLLGWDERTYMPRLGSAHRAEQVALLARMAHDAFTEPQVGELLAAVEGSPLVRDPEGDAAANARELRRQFDRAVKVPRELVEELARTTTRAQQVWQEARAANDFPAFRPWLEKVLRLERDKAAAIGYRESPYDALLDDYEPGMTAAEVARVFAELRRGLAPLAAAVAGSGRQAPREILQRCYPTDRQERFGSAAATAIGFDAEAGRLDTTTHPFCSGIGPGDCRITTRYDAHLFSQAFFGILHEAGHGIYEQNLPAEHFGTPCGSPASLGIHESQSRLWENFVGRSRPFWEHFFPRARDTFPEALRDVRPDDFHFAVNDVRPSLIRVEADEVTYNLHIILRFELEQAMLTGDLPVGEVPGAWDEKCGQVLGLRPKTAAEGCLQDIHWSMGGFGYFPTYTLGNLYAAQLMERAREDLPGLEDDFRRGEFGRLKGWLVEKVHRSGRRRLAAELVLRVTGRPPGPGPLLNYLRDKYTPLYLA
jgi:carboxypeptidase Taq